MREEFYSCDSPACRFQCAGHTGGGEPPQFVECPLCGGAMRHITSEEERAEFIATRDAMRRSGQLLYDLPEGSRQFPLDEVPPEGFN